MSWLRNTILPVILNYVETLRLYLMLDDKESHAALLVRGLLLDLQKHRCWLHSEIRMNIQDSRSSNYSLQKKFC